LSKPNDRHGKYGIATAFVIDGDLAVLPEGPLSSTEVVTVGAAELFGTEFGAGK
jgi:hypothetical protein